MKIYCLVLLAFSVCTPALSQRTISNDVDYRRLVAHADLVYDRPVDRSEAGMPVGNGQMGSLVWTSASAIHFQLNRNDIFGNNSASNSFYEPNTDYCGGAGFVDIDFGKPIFEGKDFLQRLSCYDGLATVQGKNIHAEVLAWNKEDVMAINVEDRRSQADGIRIDLRMLREPVVRKGNHSAVSRISVVNGNIVLTQQFKEDSYYCGSAVVIGLQGCGAKAELTGESDVRLMTTSRKAPFTVYMASAASFDPNEDLVAAAIKKLEAARNKGFEKLSADNNTWWHRFWQKGFIRLHSADSVADDLEKNYAYYLYVMAASSRGKYPVKFNGMLWTTGGDARAWGGLYWGANQSCLYDALFTSGRLALLQPMFDMYTGMYARCASAAKQEWGSQGIYIPETVGFDGPQMLPDSIGSEMQALYLGRKPWKDRSEAFVNYANTKLPFLSMWNWKKNGRWKDGRWEVACRDSSGPFGPTSHIFSRGAKIAYQYWLYYEYTRDTAWLRRYAYPMLKGIAEFYRNFPNVKKEKDGKFHIYYVNDNEPLWGGHNTVEEISSMKGIFPVLIRASQILDTDAVMRAAWQQFIRHLSPLPDNADDPDRGAGKVTWIRSLAPADHGERMGLPDKNTMPVWSFDLCNTASEDTVFHIGNHTYDAYFDNGINEKTDMGVLSELPAVGVKMGRVEATRYLIPNQVHAQDVVILPNRMDEREGRQTTNIERLGRAASALQDALVQSVPPSPGADAVISVFPAWPREWDGQFELLCRGNFRVSASMRKGIVSSVQIKSEAGGICRLKNPWQKQPVTIYRNGKRWKEIKNRLLELDTDKGDIFNIIAVAN